MRVAVAQDVVRLACNRTRRDLIAQEHIDGRLPVFMSHGGKRTNNGNVIAAGIVTPLHQLIVR